MPDLNMLARDAQRILDLHHGSTREADIGVAVRDFLIRSELASNEQITLEQPPAPGSTSRVDLLTDDVIVEFKRRIGNGLDADPGHVRQLDNYLREAMDAEQPQRFGILTDGKYWLLRRPGMGAVRTTDSHAFTLNDAEHGLLLYEWLRDESQALEARDIEPTDAEIRNRLGAGPRFEQHLSSLRELYLANRDHPTIAVKRELWRRLLAAALGEVVDADTDLDELFVRHTYLSVVVGLAVQSAFGINLEAELRGDPRRLITGDTFVARTGVRGVVESDFFTWPAEIDGERWLRDLAGRVARFDWKRADFDIARILYEAVIPADDRRRLGEYYTPDWLARAIVDAVVTDPLQQRVLDPACGSGSFIHAAVRKYLSAARADGRNPRRTLDGLLSHVIGIDVHPVAVHLARATWTFAARDALAAARGLGVDVNVPIYLGDSLQLQTARDDMFARDTVTITVADVEGTEFERNLSLEFPRALVEQADWFDSLLTRMAEHIETDQDPVWVLNAEGIGGDDYQTLKRTAETLRRLHREGRDHIWAYYTKNLVRPVALRANPVDVIVGNPPWLNYRNSDAVVRQELERQSKDVYDIWTGRQYATHQDIAGLFYARCVDLYLKPGGVAAMVLPHSALQTGQYAKWRDGQWGELAVDLSAQRPWDLERIEPNTFFPVPASVAFTRRVDQARPLPMRAHRWRGPEGGPFTYETVKLTDTSSKYASPYGDQARQGATIVPRVLFFVNAEESGAFVQTADLVQVSPRRSAQEKRPWKDLQLPDLASQPIEAQHLFDVHLGETVAPYVLLEPLKAVLPLSRSDGQLIKKDESGWYGIDPLSLDERMRRRWRIMSEHWEQYKSGNNKLTLIERIDYMGNLSAQRHSGTARHGTAPRYIPYA